MAGSISASEAVNAVCTSSSKNSATELSICGKAPVDSPTSIISTARSGKTPVFSRLCDRLLPSRTVPTEVITAWEAGADYVKVFPCSALGGPSYLKALLAPFPQLKLIPTGGVTIANAADFLKAGAQAYVMKNLVHKELLQTIRAVYAGRKTMSPEVAAQVAAHAGEEALTSREIDVLRLIAMGSANKEIAAQLSITEDTVKSRVKNILLKLGANDRTHAVTTAMRRGIIEL